MSKRRVSTKSAVKTAKPKRRVDAWLKKHDNELRKCLNKGMSAVETAEVLGRSTSSIYSRKHKLIQEGEIRNGKSFRQHHLPMESKTSKTLKRRR